MVDLRASNEKLRDRGARIISTVTGLSKQPASDLLRRADGHVKVAIVMLLLHLDAAAAESHLAAARGSVRAAVSKKALPSS
jgi:N-acetylmuramic acid 6-phosphate etherase